MTDSSGPSLVPPRDARLTPEAIAERGFSQVKRGYSESEVRAYLRMVADELAAVTGHERDLANRVRSLEERLSAPKPPPSDQDLITALGEETARVLGQARESAAELRTKAEEHARRMVREAQESARELRQSTQQAVETKTREAEDAARARAKDIVGEARTMRERVLADLNERRQELERQISELRSGRGRLVETYQVVERALVQATRVMADEPATSQLATAPSVEAPSAEQPVVAQPAPTQPGPSDASAPARDERASAPAADSTPTIEAPPPDAADTAGAADAARAAGGETRDVGELFEKLRSEQIGPEEHEQETGSAPLETSESTDAAGDHAAAPDAPTGAPEATTPSPGEAAEQSPGEAGAGEGETEAAEELEPVSADRRLIEARDDELAGIAENLSRRAKRVLQDEQNDVLDGLRRQRGKIDTTKILPPTEDQLARWAHVLQPAADAAYAAGAAGAGAAESGGRGKFSSVPRALLSELADAAVAPLRGRLETSLDAVDGKTPADMEIAIAQALGARYREWRTQDLDTVLGDALAVAYSRGVYDAAPEGAQLRWIAAREGKCPDCDDNALEPTVRGNTFPTGQAYPPAHPGCRCLLTVVTA